MRINDMVKEAHETAKSKGWWDEEKSFGEVIALMHSELSEALEEARAGNDANVTYYECKNPQACPDDKYVCGACCSTDRTNASMQNPAVPSELADCAIRIFDACGRYGIDLEQAIRVKMEYNRTAHISTGRNSERMCSMDVQEFHEMLSRRSTFPDFTELTGFKTSTYQLLDALTVA